jgi:hypothetical protein
MVKVIDDRADYVSDICLYCKHLSGFRICKAFKEIPLEIWNSENDHRKPYPGDNGIQFEERN